MTNEAAAEQDDGWEWAIVEIFGHRRHAGRTREEERFGGKLLRIDVPKPNGEGGTRWETHYYGAGALFSYTLTDEATAHRVNRPYEPPSRIAIAAPDGDAVDDDGGES